MHLASASFDPQLIKGEAFQDCKGLTASIKNNCALVEQSFHSLFSKEEDLMHHTLQSGDFISWKRQPSEEASSKLLERLLSGFSNQPLSCKTLRNRPLDLPDIRKESTEPWPGLPSLGDLNWHRWDPTKPFSQNIWMRPVENFSPNLFDDIIPQKISSVYNLENIWTCDKRYMRVLSPDPPHCLNVTLIGFQSVHFPSHIRHYTQERYFLILRDKKLLKLENLFLDQQCFQRMTLIKREKW